LSRRKFGGFSRTGLIESIRRSSVEVMGEVCFSERRSHFSVSFQSGSRLSRIRMQAFGEIGLVEIIVSGSLEITGEKCLAMHWRRAPPGLFYP
jgi:hypothetical protein